MPTDIDALLKKAKPRETTVAVYLDGATGAEIERLERQLAQVGADEWAPSLADTDLRRPIAEKIAAARRKLRASEAEFRFRALPDWSDDPEVKTWSDLLAAHPPENPAEVVFNVKTFPRVLISACAIDPVMTPEQVDRLFAVINQAQRDAVFQAAYDANTEASSVPFSVSASAILAAHGDGK
ncbi:hypothetical protein ACFO3J_24120 [Streptomyces polygonati]|uniref:Uncharacterized protein n=1 Tax=Streptomyces polygonati TaxID=1617087 RepID=A0ABV8HR55_9ACTN